MRSAQVTIGVVLLGLMMSCTQRQEDQAHKRAEEARSEARTAAEKMKNEARRLGRDAEADARQLKRDVNQAAKPGPLDRDTTPAGQKLQKGTRELQTAADEAAVKLGHAALIARVKAKLAADAGLSTAGNVSVEANGDVVTLRGTVSSEAQKTEAQNAASQADGVRKVINDIQVQQ